MRGTMSIGPRARGSRASLLFLTSVSVPFAGAVSALAAAAAGPTSGPATTAPAGSPPANWTAADDHRDMMRQLGIRALRPGPSGNEAAPNHANYDEAKANPFPDLPDALTTRDGTKVTTPQLW